MIAVEDLEQVVNRLLCSCCVKDILPLSAMIIAPSDAGKSKLALSSIHSGDTRFVRVLADCTGEAILQYVKDKRPRYLIFPDFNMVLSHRPSVAKFTIAVMLALLGEGAREIPGLDGKDKLSLDEATKKVGGLRTGVLLCMTPQMFRSNRGHWRNLGLLRRLVPIMYTYSPATVLEIMDGMAEGKVSPVYSLGTRPLPAVRAIKSTQLIREKIKALAISMQQKLTWMDCYTGTGGKRVLQAFDYPFSMFDALLRYAQASAVVNNNSELTDLEYADVVMLSKYISVDIGVSL